MPVQEAQGHPTTNQANDLSDQVNRNSDRIERLIERVDAAEIRADAADLRAEAYEAQSQIDREILATLQLEGDHARLEAEQLKQALATSRTIGAAVGYVMATHKVDEVHAIAFLKRLSSETNVKLSVLSAQLLAETNAAD